MAYLRRNLAAPAGTLPALTLSDGTLEALKSLGLVLMTLDHVNKYLLHSEAVLLFDLGRVVMPIFAFVLAYNLARPDAFDRADYPRVMPRMAIAGVLATPRPSSHSVAWAGAGGRSTSCSRCSWPPASCT